MSSKHEPGRVALVTGAAGGFGLHFVERLARDGCDVVVTDIVDCSEAVARVEGAGRRAVAIPCELSDPDAIDALAKQALAHFGRVDIVVNNAAVVAMAPFDALSGDMLHRMLVVNVEAPFLLAKALAPNMRERGWGRIVNIVTGSAWTPAPPLMGYIVSKMGLVGLTRGLAANLANDGVTVNAIAPGLTRTPPTEALPPEFWNMSIATQMIRRASMPEDLGGVLSFLCSDDAGFLTGQTIHADGGAVV